MMASELAVLRRGDEVPELEPDFRLFLDKWIHQFPVLADVPVRGDAVEKGGRISEKRSCIETATFAIPIRKKIFWAIQTFGDQSDVKAWSDRMTRRGCGTES
jgi:hypothetical protein